MVFLSFRVGGLNRVLTSPVGGPLYSLSGFATKPTPTARIETLQALWVVWLLPSTKRELRAIILVVSVFLEEEGPFFDNCATPLIGIFSAPHERSLCGLHESSSAKSQNAP